MSSGSGSSSPRRTRVEKENERPSAIDSKAKSICWANADIVPGVSVTAKAASALSMTISSHFRKEWLGAAGGESVAENCQILQTRVNRFKANEEETETAELKGYSRDINFTDKELDIIEMAVYGNVIRPGNHYRCRTVAEMLGKYKSRNSTSACQLP